MIYLIPLSTLPLLAYGWILQHQLHPSIPLILQFFMGGSIIVIFNAYSTLIIDLHPSRPSTAQAFMNIARCTFAAGSLAALQSLINAVGAGWCFTIVALVTGGTAVACVIAARVCGEHWRRQRQSSQPSEESEQDGALLDTDYSQYRLLKSTCQEHIGRKHDSSTSR